MADADPNALEQAVSQALRQFRDPLSGQDLVAAGLVESVRTQGGMVHVAIAADRARAEALEPIRVAAEAALRRLPGILNATVVLTAHRQPAAPPALPPSRPAAGHRPIGLGGAPSDAPASGKLLSGARAVIAVASGKGGVGKSTTAVNLAIGLSRLGLSVGLLDADIHGPSLPRMLGITHQPEVREKRLIPIDAWGLKVMSIGFLVEERTAMIWRGPMVMGALQQLMGDVEWGQLDVMVVDMPPGTGDAQLTMAQKVSLAGAVIVSTPQDIALLDARRGVAMFEKTNVPVLGIVENMSTFCCPNCGHTTELFGHGGAKREAAALGVPFLGEIPLLLDIRTSADAGMPVMAVAPDSPAGRAYDAVAVCVLASLRPQLEKSRPSH